MLYWTAALVLGLGVATVSADGDDVASIILDAIAGPNIPTSAGFSTTFVNEKPFQTTGIQELAKHDFGQVGASSLGRLDTPYLQPWLPDADGKPYEAAPWRLRSVFNSDGARTDTIPTTNVVRKYNFTVHRGLLSPDGILKDAIMVNGQHPGPTIEANWGDWIEIDVHNDIASPAEGTAIHAHGMLQKGTGWADGVSGITQCPIAPGQSFTYRFRAEVHGSSFWHAHYSSQYTAGIIGPIVIHGPSVQPYDVDVGPVMLSDLNHIPYFAIVSDVVGLNASFIPASSDTLMLNGRNSWNCHNTDKSFHHGSELLGSGDDSTLTDRCVSDAPLSNFTFQAGKTHRLRLINHAADIVHKVSIDGLFMTVIAQDFVPVQPYTADVVTIGVAQRTDVLVTAPSDPKAAYWMRSVAASGPSCGHSKYGLVKAAIFNHEADTNIYPTTKETRKLDTESCTNDLTLPVPAFQITPTKPSYVQDVMISIGKNETGHTVFGINNSTYRANFNDPILRYASQGQTTFPDHPEWNVYDYGSNTSIVFNITNPTPITHPFHLHLANMYILASGPGVWDGSVAAPSNPTRRDTWMVPPHGYSVFQIESENPGVFPLHCHVSWHLSAGLSMTAILNADKLPAFPEQSLELCDKWDAYSRSEVVDQIDAA